METKLIPFTMTAFDPTGRTIEGYANVFGVRDLGGDIVHPGAFAKTLAERGGKVRLLWQHNPNEPLGPILDLHEDPKGLYIKAVISDTARGRDALALVKDNAFDGFSIGYDPIKGGLDYTKEADGSTTRNLREVKLWEVSLVTFPMNEASTVTSLKSADGWEGKPYGVIHEGDKWRVYKLDAEGKPTGDPLGEHDTEEEARAQQRAVYANEGGKERQKAGRRMRGDMRAKLGTIQAALDELSAWADYMDEHPEDMPGMPMDETPEAPKSADAAGPVTPPTEALLDDIDFQLKQIELLKE